MGSRWVTDFAIRGRWDCNGGLDGIQLVMSVWWR